MTAAIDPWARSAPPATATFRANSAAWFRRDPGAELERIALHGVRDGVCTCPRGAECASAGKHPAAAGWRDADALTDKETRSHVARGGNVGARMGGALRLVALDIDGPAGRGTLATAERKLGALPRTLSQRSGRADGGEHRLFRVPAELDVERIANRTNALGPGLDVRAHGAQIVIAPSVHASGGVYAWSDKAPIAEITRAWFDALIATAAPPATPAPSSSARTSTAGDTYTRAVAYLAKLEPSVTGQGGHAALFRAAQVVVNRFEFDDAIALALLRSEFNPRCRPPWSERELEHKVKQARKNGKMETGIGDRDVKPANVTGAPVDEEREAIREEPASPAPVGFVALSFDELCAPVPEINYLVKGLDLSPGRPAKIVGVGGGGKTLAALSMELSVIVGRRVWGDGHGAGFWCRQGPAAHFDYEMGKNPSLRRARRLAIGMGVSWAQDVVPGLRLYPMPRLYMNTEGVADHFKRAVDGCAIAVIDSLRRALPGEDENDSGITRYMDVLTRVSEDTQCSFLILHHATTKRTFGGDGGDPRGAGRGSSALFDACGSELLLSGKRGEPMLVQHTRTFEGSTPAEDFYLAIEDVEIEGQPKAGLRVVYRTVEQVETSAAQPAEIDHELVRIVAAVRREGPVGVAGADAAASLASMKAQRGRAAVRVALSRGLLVNVAKLKSGEPDEKHPRYVAPAERDECREQTSAPTRPASLVPLKGGTGTSDADSRPGTCGTNGTNGTSTDLVEVAP